MVDYRQITRENILFDTKLGALTPQDLWQLNINVLREIGKTFYAELQKFEAENGGLPDIFDDSPTSVKNSSRELANLKFETIKDILQTKIEERTVAKNAKERRQKMEQLKTILHQKENDLLSDKSPEELRIMIEELK